MIDPNIRIQYINDDIGYGVFATRMIPKGSAVYVKDSLEIGNAFSLQSGGVSKGFETF
ncbi:hypothetical protein OAF63_02020 [Saprospiraceae bacterium]|jgi:hypothetical protein|nr:hypothetical protein [Bacteroidota bacterium]MDB4727541.1 hypothetical protein [Saprospiraceae bacterium]MDF1865929.1 hypothetical protein [Saprospiraceae bacterium]